MWEGAQNFFWVPFFWQYIKGDIVALTSFYWLIGIKELIVIKKTR